MKTPFARSSIAARDSKPGGAGKARVASVLALVELVVDQYRLHEATRRGEVPREAYWSETAGNVGKAAGGLGGTLGGAALGSMIAPGVGTAVGGMLGAMAGSRLGQTAARWIKSRFSVDVSVDV